MRSWRDVVPSIDVVVYIVVAILGASAVAAPISDNTLFTHLRLGIDFWRTHTFPSTEQYSFTATGTPLIQQSWLVDVWYGLLHEWFGDQAIRFFHMAVAATTAVLLAMICKTQSFARWICGLVAPMLIAVAMWSTRPYLVAVLLFALLVLTVRERSYWWTFGIALLWTHVHGTFVFGFVWLALVVLGEMVDRRLDARSKDSGYHRHLVAFFVGCIAGVIGPGGPARLIHWAHAVFGERATTLRALVEWQSLDFQSITGAYILSALVVLTLMLRVTRISWTFLLPAGICFLASLLTMRHFAFFGVAICALFAPEKEDQYAAGSDTVGSEPVARNVVFIAITMTLLCGVMLITRVISQPPFDLRRYPQDELTWLDSHGYLSEEMRMVAPIEVGNLVLFQRPDVRIFLDDRFDIYPVAVTSDYLDFRFCKVNPADTLAKYNSKVLLWRRDSCVESLLVQRSEWRKVRESTQWVVFVANDHATPKMKSGVGDS